jgi:hypothetical protein
MAGTGKSTISRTVAQMFADEGILGASFFFKRGELDRGSAARLFTTISAQIIAREPSLAEHVRAALDEDSTIPNKSLKVQFEKLILEPLSRLKGDVIKPRRMVLVIDALDECEGEDNIKLMIHLLSRLKTLHTVQLVAFVTSRPELPIRLGFEDIRGRYEDLVLHEIEISVIENDITAYLEDELEKIRTQYNNSVGDERQLIDTWPGQAAIENLVNMAVPLFIFAATVCRFISDRRCGGPELQLQKVLKYQTRSQQSKLDATYLPILDQLIAGLDRSERRDFIGNFRRIVGSIVLLNEPLSTPSLASLIGVPKEVLDSKLDLLHSVLSIPTDSASPIRLFHLSFRDFITDPTKCDTNPFWIDERAGHETIATRCLDVLFDGYLKKNICNLKRPASPRTDVEPAVIELRLPIHVRYACLYWAKHLSGAKVVIDDDHRVHVFLKRHFLHWLEALSLLGKLRESIEMIKNLQTQLAVGYIIIKPHSRGLHLIIYIYLGGREYWYFCLFARC